MGEAAVLVLCPLQDVCLEGRMGFDIRSIAISFALVGTGKKNQATLRACDRHAQVWKKFGPGNIGHLVCSLLVKKTGGH